jgi:hypothetical protein
MKIFQQIARLGNATGITKQSAAAAKQWFRTQAMRLQNMGIKPEDVMKEDPSRLLKTNRIGPATMGKMVMFFYDPKTKKTLPYYDRFPLIFPVDTAPGGFYGINMHYLSPFQRAKLFDALYQNHLNNGKNENKKLQIDYLTLKGASNLAAFKPCFKHYLYSHVRSKFYVVAHEHWDVALMLPTERFEQGGKNGGRVGAPYSKQKVWADSAKKF